MTIPTPWRDVPDFGCPLCRDTGHVFGPLDDPFGNREILECEGEVCIKRRATEALQTVEKIQAEAERKIFKGGELKVSTMVKGFELPPGTIEFKFGSK